MNRVYVRTIIVIKKTFYFSIFISFRINCCCLFVWFSSDVILCQLVLSFISFALSMACFSFYIIHIFFSAFCSFVIAFAFIYFSCLYVNANRRGVLWCIWGHAKDVQIVDKRDAESIKKRGKIRLKRNLKCENVTWSVTHTCNTQFILCCLKTWQNQPRTKWPT